MIAIARAKEVIEADLEQIGGTGVACDVAAKLAVGSVGAHDHCKSIPAHQRSQTLLYREVAWKHRLVTHRYRIDVRGRQRGRPADPMSARALCQNDQKVACTRGAAIRHHRVEGVAPLGGLLWLSVFDHGSGGAQLGERDDGVHVQAWTVRLRHRLARWGAKQGGRTRKTFNNSLKAIPAQ